MSPRWTASHGRPYRSQHRRHGLLGSARWNPVPRQSGQTSASNGYRSSLPWCSSGWPGVALVRGSKPGGRRAAYGPRAWPLARASRAEEVEALEPARRGGGDGIEVVLDRGEPDDGGGAVGGGAYIRCVDEEPDRFRADSAERRGSGGGLACEELATGAALELATAVFRAAELLVGPSTSLSGDSGRSISFPACAGSSVCAGAAALAPVLGRSAWSSASSKGSCTAVAPPELAVPATRCCSVELRPALLVCPVLCAMISANGLLRWYWCDAVAPALPAEAPVS